MAMPQVHTQPGTDTADPSLLRGKADTTPLLSHLHPSLLLSEASRTDFGTIDSRQKSLRT